MFENLTERFNAAFKALRGRARLSEENIAQALREVRATLLEADVALPAAREFIDRVRARAVGREVAESLTPGQALIGVVRDELVALMGARNEGLDLKARSPAVVLLAGLQGAGKTTTAAKLARLIAEREQKTTLLASADVYRPAAIAQLRALAEEVGAEFFPSDPSQRPTDIVRAAIEHARRRLIDVALIDTAGRQHVDDAMMAEVRALHAAANPVETLFVVDGMTGQDAVNAARAFNDALPLTGVILTKVDGDARGGAALSIRRIAGKPIKFLGVGEKSDALEPFHPERVASRILGMGDVLSLIEEVERKVDQKKAARLVRKAGAGKRFDLVDFRDQLLQLRDMGGLSGLMEKLPETMQRPAASRFSERELIRMTAAIDSMTPQERRFPDLIRGGRKRRIAAGSGSEMQEISRLLKQFAQMQKQLKKMKGGKMARMMRGMAGMPGAPGATPAPPGGRGFPPLRR